MPDAVLASLADARVLSLTTIGRHSGHPQTIAIWFTCYPRKRHLNAARAQNANLVRTILQPPDVQVHIKEQQLEIALRPCGLPAHYPNISLEVNMYWPRLSLLVALKLVILLVVFGCSSGSGTGETGTPSATTPSVTAGTAPPLVAGFSATPTTGPTPLAVQFSDASTGSISTWAWDFGDGATSSAQNPQHTYSTAGSLTVNLTVSGAGGSSTTTKSNSITVSQPLAPVANPGATPTTGPTPPVAITAPASGSTVFNMVSVSATASDKVSVAGVQFFVDGVPFGAEVTVEPYAVVWDTTTVSPGSHSLTASVRDWAGNTTMSAPISVTVTAAPASLVGQWSDPVPWPIVAVHASLLPTGEVLAWDGADQKGAAFVWRPSTNTFTSVKPPDNIFCAGHALLSDGRLLVVGGHIDNFVGIPDANIFDPTTAGWTQVQSMHYGRWYPTAITLPDGRVLVVAGDETCATCVAVVPEIYTVATNTWAQIPSAAYAFPEYPHLYVLPNGRVLEIASFEEAIATQVLDLNTQAWTVVTPTVVDGQSSVMYRLNMFLKSGTSATSDPPYVPAAATSYVLDMTQTQPTWRETAPMVFPRSYHNLTMLPDGSVLATGGGQTTDPFDQSQALFAAELWSSSTETWTAMAFMTVPVPRLYHSTALLLPDGRVLSAGGGRFGGGAVDDQLSAEIYSPPYLFKGARPVISSAPSQISYNTSFSIATPSAARIASVALLHLGSVTHHFNPGQRYLSLSFQPAGSGLSVQAPTDANSAPPGYYMLFIVDKNGVPSVAATLRLE